MICAPLCGRWEINAYHDLVLLNTSEGDFHRTARKVGPVRC